MKSISKRKWNSYYERTNLRQTGQLEKNKLLSFKSLQVEEHPYLVVT